MCVCTRTRACAREMKRGLFYIRYGTGMLCHSRLTSNEILLLEATFLDPELIRSCKSYIACG